MSFLYFAYASNLLTQRMRINCHSAQFKCIAKLKGFKLAFCGFADSWKGATATIIESEDDSVWGAVWEISKTHEEPLNRQEIGYLSRMVNVESQEFGKIECKTFQKLKAGGEDFGLPSLIYKTVIVQGAMEHKLPLSYIQTLEAIIDNGYKGPIDIPINITV